MVFKGPKLYIDIETRSRVDLKAAGARRYAADPSTQITTASWRWAGDPRSYDACNIPGLAHLGNSTIGSFMDAIQQANHIVAHHINFDASVIFATLGPCGMTLDKLDCTMARAQRMSLPGGLDELCRSQGAQGKSLDGHRLVMATCKPRKDGTFNEDPAVFRQLLAYNVQDVRCLETVDKILPPLPPDELEIWRRTWRKNALGLPLDIELCQRIAAKRGEIELQLSKDLRSLTGGAVATISQKKRILEWLHAQKVMIPNLQRPTVESWLDMEDMTLAAYQVLTLLFESGGSAPAKAQALLDRQVSGIYQDGTRYFGARSGRGTSEGVNFFNLARPSGKNDTDDVIRRLKADHAADFTNTELSDVLRGSVVAPEGYKLLDVDLSSIELRKALWYAGDKEKLRLLAEPGADLYAATAGRAMGVSGLTKKTHPLERQAYKKCFGPETLVLTGVGYKRIADVLQEDMVWDGVAWVSHGGLLRQGKQRTVVLSGVEVTASHSFLCGTHWRSAEALMSDAKTLCQALATGSENLPLRAIWWGVCAVVSSAFSSVAIAVRRSMESAKKTSSVAGRQRAGGAQWSKRGAQTASSTASQMSLKTKSWRGVCTAAWLQFMTAVGTQRTESFTTTEVEAFVCATSGWLVERPLQKSAPATEKELDLVKGGNLLHPAKWLLCATFSRCRGTITRILNSTVSKTAGAMSRATFASLRAFRIFKTGEPFGRSSGWSIEVFDLSDCGPRRRFTILSADGPLIAHNCVLSGSYAIGVPRLYAAFKTDKDLPYEYRKNLTYAQVAAIHAGYRDDNWLLQACWKELDQCARAALFNRGAIIPACGGKLHFLWRKDADILDLRLPSGRTIPHYQPRVTDEGELVFYRAKYGRMMESRAFGGSWLEISCQSSARCILVAAEKAIEDELPDVRLLLDIYDSIVALAPAAVAEQRKDRIIDIMRRVPSWAPGLPLDAEGYVADRMQK